MKLVEFIQSKEPGSGGFLRVSDDHYFEFLEYVFNAIQGKSFFKDDHIKIMIDNYRTKKDRALLAAIHSSLKKYSQSVFLRDSELFQIILFIYNPIIIER